MSPKGDRLPANTRDLLVMALHRWDDKRARSQQVEIGSSALGSCGRQVGFQILGTQKTRTNTPRLSAIMGTAIHAVIEEAMTQLAEDEDVKLLTELKVPGIEGLLGPGHVDFYRPSLKRLSDWKSSKKASLRYFPKQGQIWQVQSYGYLLNRAGYPVDEVELVVIPRDGEEKDIRIHAEPYDAAIAEEAYSWLVDKLVTLDEGELPPPEMSGKFCQDYCDWYGPATCLGKGVPLQG